MKRALDSGHRWAAMGTIDRIMEGCPGPVPIHWLYYCGLEEIGWCLLHEERRDEFTREHFTHAPDSPIRFDRDEVLMALALVLTLPASAFHSQDTAEPKA